MHKKLILLVISSLMIAQIALGQSKNQYHYLVDLTNVNDDKLFVALKTPPITKAEIIFNLPKIIPGTYSIEDYGRFVSDLKAVDKKGAALPVEKIGTNSWKIKDATKLSKITYWIEDSFDSKLGEPEIFWPAGTNIEEGKNYILNASGFFGYFEGMKEMPFEFSIIRPTEFYGSTGLIAQQTGAELNTIKIEKIRSDKSKRVDSYKAEDYDQLVDSPLMYAKADTAVIKVGNAQVLIGAYSPNGKVTAKEIAASIREVLQAQKEYLGGKLPVDKYAFIFYFTDKPVISYGALEHSYSSLYYMPEMAIGEMNQQLRDFAAHEFFHIVTPLTVHSEEIGDFDFNDPKMSQHLWMYEGVTEYFAGNVQVKYGLITPEEYLTVLNEKMTGLDQYNNDLPFTDLSKYTLEKYHDQYNNVYVKGALIGLCLDLELRRLSKGKYGLRNLMLDLSKKYGKSVAFKDDALFDEIVKLTYPEIGDFFTRYVKGAEPLPFKKLLNEVGVTYIAEEKFMDYSMGLGNSNINVTPVEGKPFLFVSSDENLNEMGKALGFKKGDILVKMNGQKLPDLGPQLGEFLGGQREFLKEGGKFTYGVLRKDEKGELKEIELSADVVKVELTRKHSIHFNESATPEQLALRDSWLKPQ
jgi:predicted metalloprotease with PDZ domain